MKQIKPKTNIFNSVKGISIIIILCLSCFSAIIFWYQDIISKAMNNRDKAIDVVAEKCYDEFYSYYNNIHHNAVVDGQKIANSIKADIYSKYGNLSILKDELDSNIYSDELIDIFQNNIEDKYLNNVKTTNNGVVIADYNGIILDYRYDINDNSVKRTWETEAARHGNKYLYEDSIKKILEQTNDEFIVQQRTSDDGEYYYKKFTIDTFKQIYYNEGIEGFKNYSFLVPTYIYNHEDIFGTNDIINGEKVNNHKLIIIQQFNLYEQVEEVANSLLKDKSVETTTSLLDSELNSFYILGIALIISLIGLILSLCLIYNFQMGEIRKEYERDN